jgi:hypothetical protein
MPSPTPGVVKKASQALKIVHDKYVKNPSEMVRNPPTRRHPSSVALAWLELGHGETAPLGRHSLHREWRPSALPLPLPAALNQEQPWSCAC